MQREGGIARKRAAPGREALRRPWWSGPPPLFAIVKLRSARRFARPKSVASAASGVASPETMLVPFPLTEISGAIPEGSPLQAVTDSNTLLEAFDWPLVARARARTWPLAR